MENKLILGTVEKVELGSKVDFLDSSVEVWADIKEVSDNLQSKILEAVENTKAETTENIKLQKLTEYEKVLAEKNHGLVYSFLHRHGYSIEEIYNIAIFGYLKGIQTYSRRDDLRKKYQLAFICEQYMRAEVKDHFRVQNAQKRKPMETILSMDVEYWELEDITTRGNLYNCVGEKSVEDELMEMELLNQLLENLSEVQRNIVLMKMDGFSNKEVHVSLEIPSSTYYKELGRIEVIFKELVG